MRSGKGCGSLMVCHALLVRGRVSAVGGPVGVVGPDAHAVREEGDEEEPPQQPAWIVACAPRLTSGGRIDPRRERETCGSARRPRRSSTGCDSRRADRAPAPRCDRGGRCSSDGRERSAPASRRCSSRGERVADEVLVAADVEGHVVVGRAQPVDVGEIDDLDTALGADGDPRQIGRGRGPARESDSSALPPSLAFGDPLPCVRQRAIEAGGFTGLTT